MGYTLPPPRGPSASAAAAAAAAFVIPDCCAQAKAKVQALNTLVAQVAALEAMVVPLVDAHGSPRANVDVDGNIVRMAYERMLELRNDFIRLKEWACVFPEEADCECDHGCVDDGLHRTNEECEEEGREEQEQEQEQK